MSSESNKYTNNSLKDRLHLFDERASSNIGSYKSYILGKILTITDAALPDPTQRKAVKDLVEAAIWGTEYHTVGILEDIGFLSEAEGLGKLYAEDGTKPSVLSTNPFL